MVTTLSRSEVRAVSLARILWAWYSFHRSVALFWSENGLGVGAMAQHGGDGHQHGQHGHGQGNRAHRRFMRSMFGVFLQLLGFVGFHGGRPPDLASLKKLGYFRFQRTPSFESSITTPFSASSLRIWSARAKLRCFLARVRSATSASMASSRQRLAGQQLGRHVG